MRRSTVTLRKLVINGGFGFDGSAVVRLGLSLGIFKGELVLPPSRCSLYYVAHWKLIGLPWKFFLIDSRMKALDPLDLGSLINKGGHS